MNECKDCMACNFVCVGCLGTSIIDQLDLDLRERKESPTKIILGKDMFDIIRKEIHQTGTYGLKVNLKGEYVKLFGMDIEIDEYCRLRIAYEFKEKDLKGEK